MGILNITPDSFSDGGLYYTKNKAVDHALKMHDEGADIIDIGGESTRPGAEAVSLEEEMKRVVPVIDELAKRLTIPLSIDTYKSRIAHAALSAGASLVNDISGL
ncbi:MAG: dihydropteroate synthase, partial [Thermodesulfovibrionia bacterium]|nr:dihydropteroate synthase [Thermodesulfovibrionia bacterium]